MSYVSVAVVLTRVYEISTFQRSAGAVLSETIGLRFVHSEQEISNHEEWAPCPINRSREPIH